MKFEVGDKVTYINKKDPNIPYKTEGIVKAVEIYLNSGDYCVEVEFTIPKVWRVTNTELKKTTNKKSTTK